MPKVYEASLDVHLMYIACTSHVHDLLPDGLVNRIRGLNGPDSHLTV